MITTNLNINRSLVTDLMYSKALISLCAYACAKADMGFCSVYTHFVMFFCINVLSHILPGRVAQSVMCLTADTSLTADPGVVSLIPDWSHTLVEIDHEIISTTIPSHQLIQEGLLSVTSKSM